MEDADIIATYPIRLDRGKQVQHFIKTLAALKRYGRIVRGVVMDFHSTGGDKVIYRKELQNLAMLLDLKNEVLFTSQYDESLLYNCPREMVRDFMLVSNLFMLPSTSETYSFIAQEAMICKNLIVLNRDFPPIRSVYGDTPLYKQFSSAVDALTGNDGETITKYGNEIAWYNDLAKAISYYIETNPVFKMNTLVRKTRNPNYIFRFQLEPLLYADGK